LTTVNRSSGKFVGEGIMNLMDSPRVSPVNCHSDNWRSPRIDTVRADERV